MAQGPKGAEMRALAPRIDSKRRSGGGWYVWASGAPFVVSEGEA